MDLTQCTWRGGRPWAGDASMTEATLKVESDRAVVRYTDALGRSIEATWAFCGGYLPDNSGHLCPDVEARP